MASRDPTGDREISKGCVWCNETHQQQGRLQHTMTSIAYSYIRFSTGDQARGDSERRQIARCRDYCQREGLTLSEETFTDRGKSGFKGEHTGAGGQLGRFLGLVKEGRIARGGTLVVEDLIAGLELQSWEDRARANEWLKRKGVAIGVGKEGYGVMQKGERLFRMSVRDGQAGWVDGGEGLSTWQAVAPPSEG